MKGVWIKCLSDIVNLARQIGCLMYYKYSDNAHIYYVRASGGGDSDSVHYILVRLNTPIDGGGFVTLNEDGKIQISKSPIMPVCAKIAEVEYDEYLLSIIEERKKWDTTL